MAKSLSRMKNSADQLEEHVGLQPHLPETEDVMEGAVIDNTNPYLTTPKIVEIVDTFENQALVMSESIPSPDNASRSLSAPIHLLDNGQENDDDDVAFEIEKHNFLATHDPLMSVKLDVINNIDEDIREHTNIMHFDPIRLEKFWLYCRPKLQTADNMQHASKRRFVKQLLGAALDVLHIKLVILKRHRGKDRAWRFKATSKHSRELIGRRRPSSSRRTAKPFDPGKLEEHWVNEGTVASENQRSQKAYDPP
ncbi:hypothetical protein L2E82_17825 [Cichorium intybus]|uniref:Uncharacterized protein n=1 Tax=Cichorium intybus TaxID=13427 RepID=A0ACB9F9E5_CICIN|nr:hypothetical protein L2E82_17825 [Cichorium intybus]